MHDIEFLFADFLKNKELVKKVTKENVNSLIEKAFEFNEKVGKIVKNDPFMKNVKRTFEQVIIKAKYSTDINDDDLRELVMKYWEAMNKLIDQNKEYINIKVFTEAKPTAQTNEKDLEELKNRLKNINQSIEMIKKIDMYEGKTTVERTSEVFITELFAKSKNDYNQEEHFEQIKGHLTTLYNTLNRIV